MNLGQPFREQSVARHHEEDARLAEQQDEDDRRQRDESRNAEHVADAAPADLAQHVRERLVRANQRQFVGGERRALTRELFGARREGDAIGPHDRLSADRPDRARRDEDVENRTESERPDQADRHVALRILGLLGRRRNRVEADIGEEDRGCGPDRADARSEPAEDAGWQERVELVHAELVRRKRQENKGRQRSHLDRDEDRVDARALIGADHEQPGYEQRDDDGGQVDETARCAAQCKRPCGEIGGQFHAHELS